MTAEEFNTALEGVYVVLEGRQGKGNPGFGAQAWFCRLAGIDKTVVWRYRVGEVEPPGPIVTILRLLEFHAKLLTHGRARKRELQRVHQGAP